MVMENTGKTGKAESKNAGSVKNKDAAYLTPAIKRTFNGDVKAYVAWCVEWEEATSAIRRKLSPKKEVLTRWKKQLRSDENK